MGLFKQLKRFRRFAFPTPTESYYDGWEHAKKTIKSKGERDGVNDLWTIPRDAENHFDRGIIHYVNSVTDPAQFLDDLSEQFVRGNQ